MTMVRTIGAAALASALVAGAADCAQAARFFDPLTRSWVTYGGEAAKAPRQARRRDAAPREVRRGRAWEPDAEPVEQAALPSLPPLVAAPAPEDGPRPGPEFDRQVVAYDTDEPAGSIVIDTAARFLYYLSGDGEAIRYGVGVGREGFGWTGTVHVGALQEWPKWFPPAEMVARRPELATYQKAGMPGGEQNPLGARALYLHDDSGKDTLFRIHGTNEPWSIGQNVSSGCIRMLNENVTELHGLVKVGAKVVVL